MTAEQFDEWVRPEDMTHPLPGEFGRQELGGSTRAMTAPDDLSQGLAATLRLGVMMLRSGTTAARVREAMTRVATGLGIERLVVTVSFDFMVATVWRNGATVTQAIDSPAPGINAARIATIDALSRRAQPGLSAADLDYQLDIIERTAPLHALATTAVAVGLACGRFSFLNNGNPPIILATILAAGLGQLARSLLLRRRVNQLAVTVICAIGAASLYVAIAATCARAGIAVLHGAGFISCVLFLIPVSRWWRPCSISGRYDFTAGVARLAYGAMILLGVVSAYRRSRRSPISRLCLCPFGRRTRSCCALSRASSVGAGSPSSTTAPGGRW